MENKFADAENIKHETSTSDLESKPSHRKQTTSPPNRLRHTQLRPLSTQNLGQVEKYGVPIYCEVRSPNVRIPHSATNFRVGIPHSAISPRGLTPISSRYYYRDHKGRAASHARPFFRTPPNTAVGHQFPRRYSLIVSPGGLTNRLEAITLASPLVFESSAGPSPHRKSIAAESREILLSGLISSEFAKVGTVASRRRSDVNTNLASRTDISNCPHKALREWGRAYLGHTATADIFVKALSLPRPSVSNETDVRSSEKPDEPESAIASTVGSEFVVIKAKVTPMAKERKPFLIQRRFDLEELRANANTEKARKEQDMTDTEESNNVALSSEERFRSVFSSHTFGHASDSTANFQQDIGNCNRRWMPIHIEYALHYLPVLGALMLSGHIRKGDTVDLPLPYPEAWRESVVYAYTGKGEVTEAMKRNIVYLAGHVD